MEEINLMSLQNCVARLVSRQQGATAFSPGGCSCYDDAPLCQKYSSCASVTSWLQCGTGINVLTVSYLAGLLPAAIGDWSNIVGALCYIPMVSGDGLVVPLHQARADVAVASALRLRPNMLMSRGLSCCWLVQNLVLPMLMWNTVQRPPCWRRIGHIALSGLWCMVRSCAALWQPRRCHPPAALRSDEQQQMFALLSTDTSAVCGPLARA